MQRTFHGVGGGLVGVHLVGARWILRPAGLQGYVEHLAGDHLGAHLPPRLPGTGQGGRRHPRVSEHVIGPGERQVADEDRLVHPVVFRRPVPTVRAVAGLEGPVHGRTATPGVGMVDDVVVHQGAGLDELQGTDRVQDLDGPVPCAPGRRGAGLQYRPDPCPGEEGTYPLAALHEPGQVGDAVCHHRIDTVVVGSLPGQERREPGIDGTGNLGQRTVEGPGRR